MRIAEFEAPGCSCEFCTWTPERGTPRHIMCRQRWDRLPPETQVAIGESCAD